MEDETEAECEPEQEESSSPPPVEPAVTTQSRHRRLLQTSMRKRRRKAISTRRTPVDEAKTIPLESIVVPAWIESDDEEEENEYHGEDAGDADDADDHRVEENKISRMKNRDYHEHSMSLSLLEQLGPDTSAAILQHLSVQEIVRIATASKTMYQAARHNSQLWKRKFQARWNFGNNSDSSSMDWFQAYQQAYWNTDDLWITHWNCVDPFDGLGPGRCCIQSSSVSSSRQDDDSSSTTTTTTTMLCPNCRYHSTFQQPTGYSYPKNNNNNNDDTIATQAQAVAAATCVRLQQQQQYPEEYPPVTPYSSRRAQRAFTNAATLHRHLDISQYQSESLHFLSDLLFFQVDDDANGGGGDDDDDDDDPIMELQDLKHLFENGSGDRDHQSSTTSSYHSHEASETALHSWHLCHFTNPDYKRPLVWRISIMRKDCFTVYPSEGYLAPGQSQVVVFGVRPLASLLAHATQQLNAHREGVDAFWANVYTEEAHLPPAPFLIHYHFATERSGENGNNNADSNHGTVRRAHPTQPPTRAAQNRDTTTPVTTDHATALLQRSTPWQRSGKPDQPVRIMYLSAHVNVQYSLAEFRRATLVPFSIHDRRTIAYWAPQLNEFYPSISKVAERLHLEEDTNSNDSVQAHAYRTEGPCESCSITWGPRLEELGQAYVVGQLECAMKQQRQNAVFRQISKVLTVLLQDLQKKEEWTERHHQVCFEIHKRLVDMRAAPSLSHAQRKVLCQWEAITDILCLRYSPTDGQKTSRSDYFMIPWRHAGVFRNILCTDSVFSTTNLPLSVPTGDAPCARLANATLWKDEPKYLEAFAHLAHSPGRFCLGPQEDPNHLRSLSHPSRYDRRQRGCVTDMFFDDPVCGLQAALCVVSDPRSLMVHGIWDRVAYPGTLIRRPKLLQLPPLRAISSIVRPKVSLSQFLSSRNILYYQLQNTLDMESLLLIDSWCLAPFNVSHDQQILYPLSLQNYIQNVPPPGAGRFPLSMMQENEIRSIVIVDEDAMAWTYGDEPSSLVDTLPNGTRNNNIGHNFHNNDDPHLVGLHARPGPRILNLLWVLSAHLGWTVDDNQGAASVYVDRRILIGAQWLSISLMAAPLFWTLVARYARWIPATPVDYPLQALPFHVETELRFLSEHECGYVSFFLFFSWLCLGRWIERYTSRDFFRAMLEHLPSDDVNTRKGLLRRLYSYIQLWCQRKWDSVCPLFLQRMVFVPKWNRRSRDDLMKHIAFWRSNQDQAASTTFRALSGGGFVVFHDRDGQIHLGEVSRSTKVFLSIMVSLASFSASSPHFFLNLLTVFSSSISLGLSMSLQSMETGRAGVTISETGSIVETLSLVTIVIMGFLVGQLVGSSGGVLFLAEFVVTSISLVLGGAGTISASAMESWGTFFCLGVTAFWGYLFGRVSIMEGIKQKRSGFSSIMLCLSLLVLAILWTIVIFAWKWESPMELVIHRPDLHHTERNWVLNHEFPARKLQ